MPCTISKNGLGIKTRALIDTGANGFIFIDSQLAQKASRFLDTPTRTLEIPCQVKGFDGKTSNPIEQYLEMNLHIAGRKQVKLPMLVIPLGGQDMIIGRAWASKYNTLIDCQNRQLLWPDDLPEPQGWNKVITTHKKKLFPPINHEHQRDAQRRDQQMIKDIWRQQRVLSRTWKTDQAREHETIKKELQEEPVLEQLPVTHRQVKPHMSHPMIDICGISAEAFRTNLKQKENTFFTTSLYEIDQILQKQKDLEAKHERQPQETELQWLRRLLPEQYHDYADVFSKEASNKLPPHRPYDHKIQLEDPTDLQKLGYSPLYHQPTAELEAIKKYLIENLNKGFVEGS